jgi:hypothetical protein
VKVTTHPLSILQYVFMEWCLVKHSDNFTFPLSSRTHNDANKSAVFIFEPGTYLLLSRRAMMLREEK